MEMEAILLSVISSAVITMVVTARFRKEVFDYVEKICDLNVDCVKEIKELSLSKVRELVDIIDQSKNE